MSRVPAFRRTLRLILAASALVLASACDDGLDDGLADPVAPADLADPTPPAVAPAGDPNAPSEAPSPEPDDDASAARTVPFPTSGRLRFADSAAWYTLHVDAGAATLAADDRATITPQCGSLSTFEIALYAADGATLVAYQRHHGCAHLEVERPTAGDYFIRIGASRATRYTLDASVAAAAETP
jgi:hypothetical protein